MARSPLILIGSAPSSGSSMFADLMDSSAYSACGPELEFFCNRRLYDFDAFKADPTKKSDLFSLRSTSIFVRYERLKHFGWTKADLFKWVDSAENLDQLLASFSRHFLEFRGKMSEGIVFEKTPQNVNAIDLFTAEPERGFIFLVRDPLYVFNSLLNRGWGVYTAATTWLLYMAKAWSYLDRPNVTIIRLEDLVARPYEIGSEVITAQLDGVEVTPDELQKGFSENSYRKEASNKLPTWGVTDHKAEIRDPNAKQVSADRRTLFESSMNMQVSEGFARRYGLSKISMEEACERFGYDHARSQGGVDELLHISLDENIRFLKKTLRGVVGGHGQLSDFRTFQQAVDMA